MPPTRSEPCSPRTPRVAGQVLPYPTPKLYSPRPSPRTLRSRRSQPPPPQGPGDEPAPASGSDKEICVEVMTFSPGDVFGELAALGGQPRLATVVTTLASELLVLSRHDLLSLVLGEARGKLEAQAAEYATDDHVLRALERNVRWTRYKRALVAELMWAAGRPYHLLDFTRGERAARQPLPWAV